MLISDNLPVRKNYFDSNIIQKMKGYCDVFFQPIILKLTSTEAHVYMRRHQGTKVKHFDVSNVIYHKFSHGAVSYTLNRGNINIMLESVLNYRINPNKSPCSYKHPRVFSNIPVYELRYTLNGKTLLQEKQIFHYQTADGKFFVCKFKKKKKKKGEIQVISY